MTTLTRPRGPLPARVYWTRRVLVLATALAMVFAIGRVLRLGSDGSSGSSGTASQAAAKTTDRASGTPSDQAKRHKRRHQAGGTTYGGHHPTKTPLPQPTGPCEPGDISITPVVDDARGGGDVKIRLELQTKVSPACTWHLSADTLTYKISSGSDNFWSSLDCPDGIVAKDLVLRQSRVAKTSVVWPAQRSDPGCPKNNDWATPGFYHVAVAAFDGEPADVQFELKLPTTPTITASPTAHGSGSAKPSGHSSASGKSSGSASASPSGAIEPD